MPRAGGAWARLAASNMKAAISVASNVLRAITLLVVALSCVIWLVPSGFME